MLDLGEDVHDAKSRACYFEADDVSELGVVGEEEIDSDLKLEQEVKSAQASHDRPDQQLTARRFPDVTSALHPALKVVEASANTAGEQV